MAEENAVTLKPSEIAALIDRAVAKAVGKLAPVTAPSSVGRSVRVAHEVEPPHGDAVTDRVGEVVGEHSRAIQDGREVLNLRVRFKGPDGKPVEEVHAAHALVGA